MAGSKSAIKMPMIAITTSISTKVNARLICLPPMERKPKQSIDVFCTIGMNRVRIAYLLANFHPQLSHQKCHPIGRAFDYLIEWCSTTVTCMGFDSQQGR